GTMVRSDGTVGAELATPLDLEAARSYGVSVTAGRDGYFAAWISEKGINAAILDSFGRVERRTAVPYTDVLHNVQTSSAWNGAVHLVVARSATRPAVAAVFDNNGTAIAPPIAISEVSLDYPTTV